MTITTTDTSEELTDLLNTYFSPVINTHTGTTPEIIFNVFKALIGSSMLLLIPLSYHLFNSKKSNNLNLISAVYFFAAIFAILFYTELYKIFDLRIVILVSVLTFIIDLFANLLADHIPDKFPTTIFISLLFVFSLWLLAPQFFGNFSPVKNNIKIESYYEKYTPTPIKNEDLEVLKDLEIVYSYNNKPMNLQEYKNFRSTTEINELSQRMYLKNKEDFKNLRVLFKK
ncbi:putative membrane protein [Peptoniphilus sp. ING2-D1G]|nr:putative membrane protein [Peptoniphilus sp. ING2-D1G]